MYLNEIAGTNGAEAEFRVVFARHLHRDELASIVSGLSPRRITLVKMTFPSVAGGTTLTSPKGAISEADPLAAIQAAFTSMVDRPNMLGLHDTQLKDAFSRQDYTIWLIQVRSSPIAVRDWWTAHWNDIRYIQPLVSGVDSIQVEYCPKCPIR